MKKQNKEREKKKHKKRKITFACDSGVTCQSLANKSKMSQQQDIIIDDYELQTETKHYLWMTSHANQ